MRPGFWLAFITAAPLVFWTELGPDTVLCEGSALAARYPLGPVFAGISGAFLAKMLLLAYLGYVVGGWLPPQLEFLPRILAASVFLIIAYRLLSDRRPERKPEE